MVFMREELPFPEIVLQALHNLCAIDVALAKSYEEIAGALQKDRFEIESILDNCRVEGFTECFIDAEGNKRYYLNAKGIIKVCSHYT